MGIFDRVTGEWRKNAKIEEEVDIFNFLFILEVEVEVIGGEYESIAEEDEMEVESEVRWGEVVRENGVVCDFRPRGFRTKEAEGEQMRIGARENAG